MQSKSRDSVEHYIGGRGSEVTHLLVQDKRHKSLFVHFMVIIVNGNCDAGGVFGALIKEKVMWLEMVEKQMRNAKSQGEGDTESESESALGAD